MKGTAEGGCPASSGGYVVESIAVENCLWIGRTNSTHIKRHAEAV